MDLNRPLDPNIVDIPPSPPQSPEGRQAEQETAARPGWLPVSRRPRPDPSPDTEPAAGGAGSAPSGTPTPAGTDQTPADERRLFRDKAETFTTIAEAGFEAIGGLLCMTAGMGTEAFLPDDDDRATVPPPVGRILARRVKMSEEANLSEAGDMIAAGIGLAAWLAKGLIRIVEARLAARRGPQPAQAPAGDVVQGQVVNSQAGPA